MLQSIWQDVQRQFEFGNRVTQIILVNVGVFIFFGLAHVLLRLSPDIYNSILQFFATSSSWLHNLTHPWVFLTYAFVHEGFWHILWNMILFYWFGRIVGDLIGDHRILPLYFWGAIAGSLLYFAIYALVPVYATDTPGYLIEASASVMATVVAAAFLAPEFGMRLILIGEVRLKYVALAIVLLDVMRFGFDGNDGGHFAHFGGMFMGYFFVSQLRNGTDMADPINRITSAISGFFTGFGDSREAPRPKQPTLAYRSKKILRKKNDPAPVPDKESRLDDILEKIKAQGMDSLSKEEREFLSLASRDK